MTESQKVEQLWETPPPDEIVAISRVHVEAMEQTDSDEVWRGAGMHHVVLHTIGRKSGKEHKVALPFWRDPEGHRIVAGSFAGAEHHPAWFINVRDRKEPEVRCRVQGGQYWSVPEILDGDEYDRIWPLFTADRAWYNDYQAKTERRIPLIRLPETRPAP
ncbi:MAG: pip [Acidimicrobiales bacterium]|nr:pip [Acidimicrobiales bacterium]